MTLDEERLARFRGPAEAYKDYREARARLAKRQKLVLTLFNELEEALSIPPPEQKRRSKSEKGR